MGKNNLMNTRCSFGLKFSENKDSLGAEVLSSFRMYETFSNTRDKDGRCGSLVAQLRCSPTSKIITTLKVGSLGKEHYHLLLKSSAGANAR
jgi:hypothetical protein